MAKAQGLAADVVIFDLEDAVAPSQKPQARATLLQWLGQADYGDRELAIRVNGVDTPWFGEDLELIAQAIQAGWISTVVIPKVESGKEITTFEKSLVSKLGIEKSLEKSLEKFSIWPMLETPAGVFAAREIAQSSNAITCLIMGTSDLAKELNLADVENGRLGLLYALSQCVLAAAERQIDILDGVCLALENQDLLLADSLQGKALGFSGKTLIHPKQIATANTVFGINDDEIVEAEAMITAWKAAEAEGSGVAIANGKLVESLHVDRARRTIHRYETIKKRGF